MIEHLFGVLPLLKCVRKEHKQKGKQAKPLEKTLKKCEVVIDRVERVKGCQSPNTAAASYGRLIASLK